MGSNPASDKEKGKMKKEIKKQHKYKLSMFVFSQATLHSGNVKLKQCAPWIMVWQVIESGEYKIFFFRHEFVVCFLCTYRL